MKKSLLLFIFGIVTSYLYAQDPVEVKLLEGEKIWSGVIKEGHKMPFEEGYVFNFYANNISNQLQPLLLSNKGLYVWSEKPYKFAIREDLLVITENLGDIVYGRSGETLKEARKYASDIFFPPSGKIPDEMLFTRPQYNTWIELTYNQNQDDILKYARSVIDNGFPAGVFMIDDTWQEDYGLWNFHPGRFPDPKKMITELHKMGFKVMLWICPFVSADQALVVREIMKGKGFLMQKTEDTPTWETAREPAIIGWWNGYSALLDFTNPAAVRWFNEELDRLVEEYDVDGFKLDAGDMDFYPPEALSMAKVTPNRHCELYAQFGLRFPLNEYRACWKMAGQPLAQRLHDKNHEWEDVQKLIPHMLTEGLAGYTFSCPDLIGGGDYVSFLDRESYDQDLVVRSAQIHALMPMMQFSVAPWRILDETHLNAVKKAVEIRTNYVPLIMELTKNSAEKGDPIIASMEYAFPGNGYENIMDQFMLGEKMLVAPITEEGAYSRNVVLPKGRWKADDGQTFRGGRTIEINVPIDRIPYFEKIR
jgi:alpha-glucosidase (family GH31 glycosyl hydrolase)